VLLFFLPSSNKNTFPSASVFSFYIFTLLMFRKLNKPQLTKIKQQNCIGIRTFDSRLYLDISFGLKTRYTSTYFGTFGYLTTAGIFIVYFDFQNFHLTTRLRWTHYYSLLLIHMYIYALLKKYQQFASNVPKYVLVYRVFKPKTIKG
jgi:hypothetical protein